MFNLNILPDYTSVEQDFDYSNAIIHAKLQFKGQNSSVQEYNIGLFSSGHLVLSRQRIETVYCLFQSVLLAIQDRDEAPYTIIIEMVNQQICILFETFKQMKKWHELILQLLDACNKYATRVNGLMSQSQDKISVSHKLPLLYPSNTLSYISFKQLAQQILVLNILEQNPKQLRDEVKGHIIKELYQASQAYFTISEPFTEPKHGFRVQRLASKSVLLKNEFLALQTNQQRQKQALLQEQKQIDHKNVYDRFGQLIGRFSPEIFIVRLIHGVPNTAKYVCKFNSDAIIQIKSYCIYHISFYIFDQMLCIEGITDNNQIQRLNLTNQYLEKIIRDGSRVYISELQCQIVFKSIEQSLYFYQLITEVLSKQITSLEISNNIDVTTCTAASFPTYIVMPTASTMILGIIAGYIQLLGDSASNSVSIVKNLQPNDVIEKLDSKLRQQKITPLQISEESQELLKTMQPQTSLQQIQFKADEVNDKKDYKEQSLKGLYYCVLVRGWLLLYVNHNSLSPSKIFRLMDCTARSGEDITKQQNVVQITFVKGCDIFFKILPKLVVASNNFDEAYDDKQNLVQYSIFDWIQKIQKASSQVSDSLMLNNITVSPNISFSNQTKQMYDIFSCQSDDTQLIYYCQCSIGDSISSFKSYPTSIFLQQNQFLIAWQQETLQTKRFYYREIQDIKEGKQGIDILAADQMFNLKLKPQDKIDFLQIIVELWQQGVGRQMTSLQNKSPSCPGLTNSDKQGWLYLRTEKNWMSVYCVLYKNYFYIYKDPKDTKPIDCFNMGCCLVTQSDQNLLALVLQQQGVQGGQESTTTNKSLQLKIDKKSDAFEYKVEIPFLDQLHQVSAVELIKYPNEINITGTHQVYSYIVNSETCNINDISSVVVSNFQQWIQIYKQHTTKSIVQSCIKSIEQRLLSQHNGQNIVHDIISLKNFEQSYKLYLQLPNPQAGIFYPGNIFKFKNSYEQIDIKDVGQQILSTEFICDQVSDSKMLLSNSSFVIFHQMKSLWLAAQSPIEREDWIGSIDVSVPKISEEIKQSYQQMLDMGSITDIKLLQDTLYQQNIKLRVNDGILIFIPGKTIMTKLQIMDLTGKEIIAICSIKNYSIQKSFDNRTVKIQTASQQELNIVLETQENVNIFIDAVEFNKLQECISPCKFVDINQMPNFQFLIDTLLKILKQPPKIDQYRDLTDKSIFNYSKLQKMRACIIALLTQLQQEKNIDNTDSIIDSVQQLQQTFASPYQASQIGMNVYSILNFILIQTATPNKLLHLPTALSCSKPLLCGYFLKVPSDFLKKPMQNNLRLVYVKIQNSILYVFESSSAGLPSEMIPLFECYVKDSDSLLSSFIFQSEKKVIQKIGNQRQKEYCDFAVISQVEDKKLPDDFVNSINKYLSVSNQARVLFNSVGLFFQKRQSHFFIALSQQMRTDLIKFISLSTPQMNEAVYESLKQFTSDETRNKQLLLSVNTLFAEYQLSQTEILIKNDQFDSINPVEGQNGYSYETGDANMQKGGEVFLTTEHICIKYIYELKGATRISKVFIPLISIQRILVLQSNVTIVFKHDFTLPNEDRCQICNLQDPRGFQSLVTDLWQLSLHNQPPSLQLATPTAYACLNESILLKNDAEFYYKNEFIKTTVVINNIEGRVSKKGTQKSRIISVFKQLGDYRAIDAIDISNIILNSNKESFLTDVVGKNEILNKTLVIFKVSKQKVSYFILRFDTAQICDTWAQKLTELSGECSHEKKQLILSFSSSGKRLALQQEVQDVFAQFVKLPHAQQFFMKVPSELSGKIQGIPLFNQQITDSSDYQSVRMQKQLQQNQSIKISLTHQDFQKPETFQSKTQGYIFSTPPFDETIQNQSHLYLLSDCLCYASSQQLEVIPYKSIQSIYLGSTIIKFQNMSVEQTLKQYPDFLQMPNTITISCTRPIKGSSYNFQIIQRNDKDDEVELASDDSGMEELTKSSLDAVEQLTFQFVITPHTISELTHDYSLNALFSQLQMKQYQVVDGQLAKEKYKSTKLGDRQIQASHTTFQLFYSLADLIYGAKNIMPPSLFTKYPCYYSLVQQGCKSFCAEYLTDTLGWTSCIVVIKFDLLFIFDAMYEVYSKFRPFAISNKLVKVVDLRRAKALDGKFLTGVEGTISIVGSKLFEWNVRLFQDNYQEDLFVGVGNMFQNESLSLKKKHITQSYNKFATSKLPIHIVDPELYSFSLPQYQSIFDRFSSLYDRLMSFKEVLESKQSDKTQNEIFETDQAVILKLSNDQEQQFICQEMEAIASKYPMTQLIKSQVEKLTQLQEQFTAEEWKQLYLPGEPCFVARCSLQSSKVSIPGRLLLGRGHFLFVGQVLGTKIYLIRRYSSFSQTPLYQQQQLKIFGGLISEDAFSYKNSFVTQPSPEFNEQFVRDIERIITQSQAAEAYIQKLAVQMNSDPEITFDNVTAEARTAFFDLFSQAIGLQPATQQTGQPSCVSCFPSLFTRQILRRNGAQNRWERILLVAYNNRCYLFENQHAVRPLASFGFKQLQTERCFVDQDLYEVGPEQVITALKMTEAEDEAVYVELIGQEEFLKLKETTRPQLFKNLLDHAGLRQCLKITLLSSTEMDTVVDQQFVFDDEDDPGQFERVEASAELFLSAESPQVLEELQAVLQLQKENFDLFITQLNTKVTKIDQAETEIGTVLKQFKAKGGVSNIQYCELVEASVGKKKKPIKQKVVGLAIVLLKGSKQIVVTNKMILDCYQQKEYSKNVQKIIIQYRYQGEKEVADIGVVCTQKEILELIKDINMMMWWQIPE